MMPRMNLRQFALYQPDRRGKIALWLASLCAVGLISYLNVWSGPAYELHIFFILPAMLIAWYVSLPRAYLLASITILLWYMTDRQLGGENVSQWPLLFNTLVRIAIPFSSIWLLGKIREILQRETRMARNDALTHLPNRFGFLQDGELLLSLARRQGTPISILFIDLDHFKRVNDESGHDTGDRLLRRVAEVLQKQLRASDLVGRLGGDEFVLLLPGAGPPAAADYAEKLRLRLLAAMQESNWPVTFSIGVASYAQPPTELTDMLCEADRLMYEVKNGGRDGIRCQSYDAG